MQYPSAHRFDAAHWHQRALQARALAEQIPDPVVRLQMIRVAESYDKLADRSKAAAEAQQGHSGGPANGARLSW